MKKKCLHLLQKIKKKIKKISTCVGLWDRWGVVERVVVREKVFSMEELVYGVEGWLWNSYVKNYSCDYAIFVPHGKLFNGWEHV